MFIALRYFIFLAQHLSHTYHIPFPLPPIYLQLQLAAGGSSFISETVLVVKSFVCLIWLPVTEDWSAVFTTEVW